MKSDPTSETHPTQGVPSCLVESPSAPWTKTGALAEVLAEVVRRIVSIAQPDQIILFGSAARGETHADSDLDLVVIKAGAHRRELAGKIYRHLIGVGHPVDLVVARPEDLERFGHSAAVILEPALREGIVIYAR
ncbi:MAG: nucleotidyltransferase domain-containing protein [Verrucomicrobia bacterium]|nr:nucleotidyltransferase domain-containing protein [Verrucomicrobiota bacterium]